MAVIRSILLGFIAGVIATVTVHEFISWIFNTYWTGWERQSWNFAPIDNGPMPGMPQLVSDAIWGGLWGALFGVILGSYPRGALTFKGMFLGLIGPALIGVFVAVPLLTGRFPPFFGGDPSKIIPVLFILAGFGAVTAWLYGLFQHGHLPGFGSHEAEM